MRPSHLLGSRSQRSLDQKCRVVTPVLPRDLSRVQIHRDALLPASVRLTSALIRTLFAAEVKEAPERSRGAATFALAKPGRQPLFTCPGHMRRHRSSPLVVLRRRFRLGLGTRTVGVTSVAQDWTPTPVTRRLRFGSACIPSNSHGVFFRERRWPLCALPVLCAADRLPAARACCSPYFMPSSFKPSGSTKNTA